MRYLLPVVAAATALSIGVMPAAAQQSHHPRKPSRANAHVTLHLSTHPVLSGTASPSAARSARAAATA
jgi:hypothetical protein